MRWAAHAGFALPRRNRRLGSRLLRHCQHRRGGRLLQKTDRSTPLAAGTDHRKGSCSTCSAGRVAPTVNRSLRRSSARSSGGGIRTRRPLFPCGVATSASTGGSVQCPRCGRASSWSALSRPGPCSSGRFAWHLVVGSPAAVAELTEAFRAMTPDTDKLPMVGNKARHLGIRDVDVTVNDEGLVVPAGGGMSVATGSFWNLPPHRSPKGLGNGSSGAAADFVYRVALPFDAALNLCVREDIPEEHHAVVEPSVPVSRVAYEAALAATRSAWDRVWP